MLAQDFKVTLLRTGCPSPIRIGSALRHWWRLATRSCYSTWVEESRYGSIRLAYLSVR